MQLLKDIMGTRYLTRDYADDVNYFFTKFYACHANGEMFREEIADIGLSTAINVALKVGRVDLDIKDCVFVGDVWDELAKAKDHSDIVHICDSGDSGREKFIREYMSFKDKTADIPRVLNLPPKPISIEAMATWTEQLDRDVVYQLLDSEYSKNPAYTLLIQLLAPDVKMELMNREFAAYAKRVFSQYMLTSCTEFYYLYGQQNEFHEAFVNKKGMIEVVNIDEYERDTFVRKFVCMPHFIGNERIAYTSAPPALKRALKTIMSDVRTYLGERPTTIESYFPLKEVYN